MEWISCIRKTIDLIENSLQEEITVEGICAQVYLSPVLLQKGFSVMTGYSIGEYLRNRRLYQAGVDLQTTDEKVIDIALKYGYETPESFTKAFTRFHSVTPSQARAGAEGVSQRCDYGHTCSKSGDHALYGKQQIGVAEEPVIFRDGLHGEGQVFL